ncbi:C-type lectin domain family 4 member A-like [Rhineura floridana]|uniref:C-type lectin domain family 4 member A-like n=1 Tax=Rhineura floridana TaxID=261503 RepID=UPI002AC84EAF|nr:C-type lectin domain family 4 member A-like [Rhineura floridana]
MASEVTYAEVKFKNGPSPAEPKAPSTPPSIVPKWTRWFPWVMSGFLMLLSIALLVVIIAMLKGSPKKESLESQYHNATEWHCLLKRTEDKEQGLLCCMEGLQQFESRCYNFSTVKMTWNESKKKCLDMGFNLVVINSEAEQDFLTKHLSKANSGKENFCVGLTDQEEKGQWRWVDQTEHTAMFWRDGEPNNDDENCVVMHIDQSTQTRNNWNDVTCNMGNHYYICETEAVIF